MNMIQADIERNPAPNVTDPDRTWGQMIDLFSDLYAIFDEEFHFVGQGGYVPVQEPVAENDPRGRHLAFNANNILATAWAYSQDNEPAGAVAPDITDGNINRDQDNLSPRGVRRAVQRSLDSRFGLMGIGLMMVKLCRSARRFMQNHHDDEGDDYGWGNLEHLDDVSRELQFFERGVIRMDVTLVCQAIYELEETGTFEDR